MPGAVRCCLYDLNLRAVMTKIPTLRSFAGTSHYTWLLDAGHGGMLNGKYTTAPAKMHTFPDGLTVYEGVINRGITDRLADLMTKERISYQYIHDPAIDTSLVDRVHRADAFSHIPGVIYLAIHSNAGGGRGFEAFTAPGQTNSDPVASIICDSFDRHFGKAKGMPLRPDLSDGDKDKEADFYVLRKTKCPAVLVENLFFDNREEADFLITPIGQQAIALCLLDAIKTCELKRPF
jgi:N-acetylmuramoyl-L-alanine amidase